MSKSEENPYLNARREWNSHVGRVLASRQMWMFTALIALLIALAAIGGVIYLGAQPKIRPYIVEVDKRGEVVGGGLVQQQAGAPDARVTKAMVAQFIQNARLVTPDVALQRKAVFDIYAMLLPADPATRRMTIWLNGTPTASPFVRAKTLMVEVEIKTVLQQSPETWQVDWNETTRDRNGEVLSREVWRGLVTVVAATGEATEQQLRTNPLQIFVRDYSWAALDKEEKTQ